MYRITLSGCDDTTYIDIDLTEQELAFANRLAEASVRESDYGCMPTMRVENWSPNDD